MVFQLRAVQKSDGDDGCEDEMVVEADNDEVWTR
jgi:hypothetical protein